MPRHRPPTPDRDRRSHPGAWLWHRLAVSLALRRDEDAERIRTVTFGWLFGLGFAALGLARQVPGAGLLGESPFELDQALRTVTLGWFATDRARPLTLVDIDTDTYAGWRQPLMTPRADLVRMLETVTAARPEAVIVDIDLSGDAGSLVPAAGAPDELHRFLAAYRGVTPLFFPRRIELDADGRRWETTSPFDDVVAANARLHWAHASFATSGGAVRDWQRWLEVCVASTEEPGTGATDIAVAHTRWLPAMAQAVTMATSAPDAARADATPPPLSNDCRDDAPGVANRLLIGPRLSGDDAVPAGDAASISARLLLEPEMQLDTQQLFHARTVLIGATHAAARDYWRTASGVLPGVELIANTVRFVDVQGAAARAPGLQRIVALGFFVFFAVATWRTRGLPKLVVLVAGTLLGVALAIGVFRYYGVFDALEAAIVLTVLYKAAVELGNVIEDWRHHWRGHRGQSARFLRTLKAVSTRQT